jgi:hypothetical protein
VPRLAELLDQGGNVFPALAQGEDGERGHRYAIEQIYTEVPSGHLGAPR